MVFTASATFSGAQVDVHPQRFQHVGAARGGRHRTPAVLGHARATRCCNERSSGGNIEGVRAVAAGAAGVDQMIDACERHLDRQLAHDVGSGGDLGHGLALHAQRDQETGNLHGRVFAADQRTHRSEHGCRAAGRGARAAA